MLVQKVSLYFEHMFLEEPPQKKEPSRDTYSIKQSSKGAEAMCLHYTLFFILLIIFSEGPN